MMATRARDTSRSTEPSCLEAQVAHQRLQRHALQHERAEHDAEGGKHDLVAAGKVDRQREGGRERHEAAHAAPGDEQVAAHVAGVLGRARIDPRFVNLAMAP